MGSTKILIKATLIYTYLSVFHLLNQNNSLILLFSQYYCYILYYYNYG